MSYIEKICEKLVSLGMKKRIITRRDDRPYLTRYYLFRKPVDWMPSVYIHCFHESDEDMELHDHPWSRSMSLILNGSYSEEYIAKDDSIQRRTKSPGSLNYIKGDSFHRVELLNPKVWTLFISGSKAKSWGFMDRDTRNVIPWQEHEKKKEFNKYMDMSIEELHAAVGIDYEEKVRNVMFADILDAIEEKRKKAG